MNFFRHYFRRRFRFLAVRAAAGKASAVRAATVTLTAAVLFVSCATSNPLAQVDKLVDAENFSRGAEILEKNKKKIYRKKDDVLYCLDKGMLSHYAGDWAASSSLLQDGERAIEANYAVSITQEIGTFLASDLSREYDGEDYEDVYLNVFNALNYCHRGKTEDALVEIRRINNKLKNLSVKYGVITSSMQKAALEQQLDIPANPSAPKEFSNSALARYLGVLLYRSEGALDDARIDRDELKLAFANYRSIYNHPVPSSVDGELEIPQGMARLNVLGFSGRLPVKVEQTLRIPISRNWIKIALPELQFRASQISSIETVLDSGERFKLELLEDIGKVAAAAFSQRKNVIYFKSILRGAVKGVAAVGFDAAAQRSTDENYSLLFSILSIGLQAYAEVSERADLRSSRYFPGKAYAGAINLKPGTYSFSVNYYGKNGTLIARRRFENIKVSENKLNLAEAVCLK
jgi:hypothetical protein